VRHRGGIGMAAPLPPRTCRSPEMTTSVTLASVVRLVSAPRRSSGDMADLQAGARRVEGVSSAAARPLFGACADAPHALVAQHQEGQLTHDLLRHALRPPRVGHRHSGAWARGVVASTHCLLHRDWVLVCRRRTARRSGTARDVTHRASVVSRRQRTREPGGLATGRRKRWPSRSSVSPHASWRAAVPRQRIGRVFDRRGDQRLQKHSSCAA
jgi:hypothetical protein